MHVDAGYSKTGGSCSRGFALGAHPFVRVGSSIEAGALGKGRQAGAEKQWDGPKIIDKCFGARKHQSRRRNLISVKP